MKFTTLVSTFLSELSAVVTAAEKNSSIPILQNVLIDAAEQVTLAATNLDHRLTTRCDAEVTAPGALLVNANKLFQIVKSLNQSAELELRAEAEMLHLKCERGKWKLGTLRKEDFPQAQTFKAEAIELPAELFGRAIAAVSHATTDDESRFALAGAKLELKGRLAKVIATDSHRLALAEFKLELPAAKTETLISSGALPLLGKLCESAQAVSFEHSENALRFTANGRSLETRTLTGAFPNYELVLPQWQPQELRCSANELLVRLRRIAPTAANTESDGRTVRCGLEAEGLRLKSQDQDEEAEDLLPAEFKGKPIAIGFRLEFLRDTCAVFAGREIVLGLKDGKSQISVKAAEADELDVTLVIMPMRT